MVVSAMMLVIIVLGAGGAHYQLPQSDLDREIYDLLRPVINAGADLYNREGDRAGCYRLYQGALLTVRPLLARYPDLQRTVDTSLADANRTTDPGARAFIARFALDTIRTRLKPAPRAAAVETGPKGPPSPEPQKLNIPPSSLWLRLGAADGVRRIVDDWVALAAKDARVDFTRGGKFKLNAAQIDDLKTKLVAFISRASEGPVGYKGKDMKEAHRGMGIKEAEFDAIMDDLKTAMARLGMQQAEIQDLTKQFELTRNDIVGGAAPGAKK
jgi:truncated hemoglobin YjbI